MYPLILYIDTDSIYTTSNLPPELVSKKLGNWKLEQIFLKSVFIAPKVYGGITDNGQEITKSRGRSRLKYYM